MTILNTIQDARLRLKLADWDLKRALLEAANNGETQRAIGRAAGISQPAVAKQLATAKDVRPIQPGFSGADPMEICQRYHLGYLSEEQLFDELTRWEYLPDPEPEHLLDEGRLIRGTWRDVEVAANLSYISDEQYERLLEILDDDNPH